MNIDIRYKGMLASLGQGYWRGKLGVEMSYMDDNCTDLL